MTDGDPDDGHLFTFSVTSRMSSKVVGDAHHRDADWESDPWTLKVRAWSLPEARHPQARATRGKAGPGVKRPRGLCKVCGREVGVRRDGTLQGHGYGIYGRPWCQGSMEKGWALPLTPR